MGKGRFEAYDHRIRYNAGRVRIKSKKKIQKAYDFAIDTLKKIEKFGSEEKSGMAKRSYKAKLQAFGRLKKFGITNSMLEEKMDKRGVKKLTKHI
ncbi:hypothetical protein KBB05_02160 [Patescibacteria group bacterium]|jgi:hypothetical protein|nr:hypothetical protein [Patescibacteria group bacterium]